MPSPGIQQNKVPTKLNLLLSSDHVSAGLLLLLNKDLVFPNPFSSLGSRANLWYGPGFGVTSLAYICLTPSPAAHLNACNLPVNVQGQLQGAFSSPGAPGCPLASWCMALLPPVPTSCRLLSQHQLAYLHSACLYLRQIKMCPVFFTHFPISGSDTKKGLSKFWRK